eukprot:s1281_g6.t1
MEERSEAVEAFIHANRDLSQHEEAVRLLRRMSHIEQQGVLRRGSMSGCRDVLAVLKTRAKQARQEAAGIIEEAKRPNRTRFQSDAAPKNRRGAEQAEDISLHFPSSKQKRPRTQRVVSVTNLAPQTTVFDLHAIFSFMHGLVAVRILRDPEALHVAQSGLCEFRSAETAKEALKEATGIELLGSPLNLCLLEDDAQIDFDAATRRAATMAPADEATELDAAQCVFVPSRFSKRFCSDIVWKFCQGISGLIVASLLLGVIKGRSRAGSQVSAETLPGEDSDPASPSPVNSGHIYVYGMSFTLDSA